MTLAERTARARWPEADMRPHPFGGMLVFSESDMIDLGAQWNPEHSNDHAMELVAEMRPTIMPEKEGWRVWVGDGATSYAESPREAICLAYLAWKEKT